MAETKKKPAEDVEVTCKWSNVWTSAGKIMNGQSVALPAQEAAELKKSGAVK